MNISLSFFLGKHSPLCKFLHLFHLYIYRYIRKLLSNKILYQFYHLNYCCFNFQEGLTIVESRTADIIQETRKHMKKKPGGSEAQNQVPNRSNAWQQPQMQPQMQTDQGLQLKASRDVRWQPCITGSYNRNT